MSNSIDPPENAASKLSVELAVAPAAKQAREPALLSITQLVGNLPKPLQIDLALTKTLAHFKAIRSIPA